MSEAALEAMKYQVSVGIADPRGKSVRARRSENVTIRQIASCCHEDNARTGNSRSSHACSSDGRGSYSKQPCIDPRDKKVPNEADRSPRGRFAFGCDLSHIHSDRSHICRRRFAPARAIALLRPPF